MYRIAVLALASPLRIIAIAVLVFASVAIIGILLADNLAAIAGL